MPSWQPNGHSPAIPVDVITVELSNTYAGQATWPAIVLEGRLKESEPSSGLIP